MNIQNTLIKVLRSLETLEKCTCTDREISSINTLIAQINNKLILLNAEYKVFNFELDFKQALMCEILVPYKMKINSYTTSTGQTFTINLNGNPYILGTTIEIRDVLEITPNIVGLIILIGELV